MSNILYRAIIKKELRKLNRKIDLNILWGLNYKEEAKKHKILLRKLQNSKREKISIFGRSFQFMTMF